MSLIRKLATVTATVATGVSVAFSGAPPELAGIAAAGVGQLVDVILPTERSRQEVIADDANRANRARAYETFGSTVVVAWQAAGTLMTFRPKLVGYVHGLALLVRAQRRFEDQIAQAAGALGSILLYGSSETQQAALDVFRPFGEKLMEVGHSGKQGSPEVVKAYEAATLDLGDKVVAWRKAAQADLGTQLGGSEPSDSTHSRT